MIVTLRLSISSSDGIMFHRLWYLKTECNLFLGFFFSFWAFKKLFIMFVNSLDSGRVAKSIVLSREHYHGRICKKSQQLQELSIQKLSNGIKL